MGKEVENILQELYEIDENLQKKEPELKKIIHSMLNLRPNITIDENFKYSLREQIQQKINSEKLHNFQKSQKNNFWNIFTYIFGTLGVAAFGFFIFRETFAPHTIIQDNTPSSVSQNLLSFESNITENKNGFGNLKTVGVDSLAKGGSVEKMSLQTPNTVTDLAENDTKILGENMIGDAMIGKMIAPIDPDWVPEVYKYSYSGELNLEIPAQMPVYKKITGKNISTQVANYFKNIDFNGIKLGNFSEIGVSNVSLNENKEYGYSLNIDFENGSFSLYKNWAKWPQRDWTTNSKQNFVSEEEVLQIAGDFIQKYKIDLGKYGNPEVEKKYLSVLRSYESSKIAPEYINNTTTVIYPLLIDENKIVEEYGQVSGVRLEIDLIEKKVTSLNGLHINNYEKYAYNIETSKENILKIANVGGRFGLENEIPKNAKYIDILLKNPTLQYISTYKYENFSQEQFLIPAVVFEIEKAGVENYYGDTITVPLVKDFYKYDKSGNIVGNSQE
ncbi:MAG: hypothetical protein AB7E37_07885 [Candidatus Altimarinota bacterium]